MMGLLSGGKRAGKSNNETASLGIETTTSVEEADSQTKYQNKDNGNPVMTREMAADKKSRDAATSHLRQQAFQRAIIRNGANYEQLVPHLYS